MTNVLIVEDDITVSTSTERWLSLEGFSVFICDDATQAINFIKKNAIDVVLSDVRMPKLTGLELQQQIFTFDDELPVILMTGHGDISMAVKAMEKGAYYFIEKPFDPEHLTQIINRAANKRELALENKRLRHQLTHLSGIESLLIGRSAPMEQLRKQILLFAGFDASIILHGDTGTGKELVANCLHDYSKRSDHPFVAINCGAIPESLLESELFGHEKGAFTGASQTRIGKLEHASKGTLFLDEIESMPMSFQIKLLRALQENTIERVGSNKSITINPRIICATKVDLKTLADSGEFRLDLYYRLNVAEIHLPKLSQRLDDIPLLFQHFLAHACLKYHIENVHPSMEDLALLSTKEWPGNIRELKNIAQQFAIANASTITPLSTLLIQGTSVHPPQLLERTAQEKKTNSLTEQVARFEEHLMINAMKECQGSIKSVMALLHISRRNLNLKMQRYHINRSDYL